MILKKYKQILRLLVRLTFPMLYLACANQGSPEGGPKDETPPKLLQIHPRNGAINFEGKKITLTFDERVDGRDVKKELIISPNLDLKYRLRTQRNTIILQFEKPLPDSTTFSLDFRQSIKDVTEKNPSAPIKLAFSTGPYIDTLRIEGRVRHSLTHKPAINTLVSLYDTRDTLKVETDKPIYFTKTDSSGNFSVSNIRRGSYAIYALNDKDKSQTYNKNNELVGFLDEKVTLKDTAVTITEFIHLLHYDEREFKLVKAANRRQYAELIFSKNIRDYHIKFENETQAEDFFHNVSENTIVFYNPKNTTSVVGVNYAATDSLGTEISGQTKLKFTKTENPGKPLALTQKLFPEASMLTADSLYKLSIVFNKPINKYFPDSILLLRGKSDTLALKEVFEANHNRTKFELGTIKGEDSLRLSLKKGAFMSVENDSSAKILKPFPLKNPSDFGTLRVGVRSKTPFILELLNAQYQVEQSVANQDSTTFNYVLPGKKFLRLISDKNNNQRWDKGSFKDRIPPEKIIFFNDTIEVKANWDIGGYEIIGD